MQKSLKLKEAVMNLRDEVAIIWNIGPHREGGRFLMQKTVYNLKGYGDGTLIESKEISQERAGFSSSLAGIISGPGSGRSGPFICGRRRT